MGLNVNSRRWQPTEWGIHCCKNDTCIYKKTPPNYLGLKPQMGLNAIKTHFKPR